MDGINTNQTGGCPFMHGGNTSMDKPVTKWWPDALNLEMVPAPIRWTRTTIIVKR